MTVCCVMAKAPVPGKVKTRLCPPLTEVQAAALAEAFLLDTWAAARAAFGVTTVLSYAGALGRFPPSLREVPAIEQRGADLGARIESAVIDGLARAGSSEPRVVVIGADLPTLPADLLRSAASLLQMADVCLGPSSDGGFYLIGASRWEPGLLVDLPWSAANTLASTKARFAERGYAVLVGSPWDDIDEPGDLEKLRSLLATDPGAAPHTAAALDDLGLA